MGANEESTLARLKADHEGESARRRCAYPLSPHMMHLAAGARSSPVPMWSVRIATAPL